MYPCSFDPLTNGHFDIARRAAQLFDSLIVAVYAVAAKHLLFSLDERVQLWQEVLVAEAVSNICVEPYTELTTDYVRSVGGQVIIKGLRSSSDFEAEFQQGLMNRQLSPEIETVCLLTTLPHLCVSSSLLKEVARWGGDVTNLLPVPVMRALQRNCEE